MSNQLMFPDALMTLIKAMSTFRDSLSDGIKSLVNASNICSQAMGNDDISASQIAKLNESIEKLEEAQALSEQAIQALQDDYRQAIIFYEHM